MKWIASTPVTSHLSPRKSVDSYGKDIALTLDGDISFENGDFKMLEGVDSFIQQFRSLLLSEATEFVAYGHLNFVPKSKDIDTFNCECEALAHKLVNQQYSESTFDDPQGLGFTIESVKSIEWDIKNDDFTFVINATGYNGDLSIFVPISRADRFSNVES